MAQVCFCLWCAGCFFDQWRYLKKQNVLGMAFFFWCFPIGLSIGLKKHKKYNTLKKTTENYCKKAIKNIYLQRKKTQKKVCVT